MTQRTRILLLLAMLASVPFGVRLWQSTLHCKIVENPGSPPQMVRDTMGTGHLPCPAEDPAQLSTSIIVLSWITFCGASLCSGSMDATDYLLGDRNGLVDDAGAES